MNKRIVGCFLAVVLATSASAQVSTTLSPYSQYGLGALAEQSQGASRGMAGLAYGLRNGSQVNTLNPASYSSVDSLTMLIDVGLTGQITNFKENNKSVNGHTATIDYAVASFRLMPKVGVALGILPYTNIGYTFTGSSSSGATNYYAGDGGISQLLIGVGWEFMKGFSLGVNFSYLWGDYSKALSVYNSDNYVNSISREYYMTVHSYKLDFGLQYQKDLGKNDLLTAGLTLGVGHSLSSTAELINSSVNAQTNVSNTSPTLTVEDAFRLPWTVGLGASVLHRKSLMVGVDFLFQKWGSLSYPVFDGTSYTLSDNYYKNRHKVTGGVDWQPNPVSRSYMNRVHYRLGASYATPYYFIKGANGPSEMVLSAGFGLPISRSQLNISGQWVRTAANDFIKENTFRINIGLTFNERWFAKWKVD